MGRNWLLLVSEVRLHTVNRSCCNFLTGIHAQTCVCACVATCTRVRKRKTKIMTWKTKNNLAEYLVTREQKYNMKNIIMFRVRMKESADISFLFHHQRISFLSAFCFCLSSLKTFYYNTV